jgi:hypothetical protein
LTTLRSRLLSAGLLTLLLVLSPIAAPGYGRAFEVARGRVEPPEGRLEVVNAAPALQTITRAAFMSGSAVHFSTLESYHRDPGGDRFVMYRYDLRTAKITSTSIAGSIEARTSAYSDAFGAYVQGTSLDPQIILYDADTQATRTVLSLPDIGAWLHGLATHGTHAFTIVSAARRIPAFDGILDVDLSSGRWSLLQFTGTSNQTYGGVESIDPTGRIWYYRNPPHTQEWYEPGSGARGRQIPGYEGLPVQGWDEWNGRFYVEVGEADGSLLKIPVDPVTLLPIAAGQAPSEQLFGRLRRLDADHKRPRSEPALYFDPVDQRLYSANPEDGSLRDLGTRSIPPVASALGLDEDGALVLWQQGSKRLTVLPPDGGPSRSTDIPTPNLSPAEITALVAGADGRLFGAAGLTMSDMFVYDPRTGSVDLLPEAVPTGEGQVNTLLTGNDGLIYGAGYPGSVPFRFDPADTWSPGSASGSNPRNLGEMGHYNQTRAGRAVQSRDGSVWFRSVTDYAVPIAHALARVRFDQADMLVMTDLDDGLPQIEDLEVLDPETLVLLGRENNVYRLYGFNTATLETTGASGPVASGRLFRRRSGEVVLLAGTQVLSIADDLSLTPLHTAAVPVLNAVESDRGELILLGRNQVEALRPDGTSQVWWDATRHPGEAIIRYPAYRDAVWGDDGFYVGDGPRLMRFTRPPDAAR